MGHCQAALSLSDSDQLSRIDSDQLSLIDSDHSSLNDSDQSSLKDSDQLSPSGSERGAGLGSPECFGRKRFRGPRRPRGRSAAAPFQSAAAPTADWKR